MLSLRKDVQMGLVIGAIVLSVVGVYVVLSAIAGAGAKQVAGAELVTDPNAGKLAASVTPVQPNTPTAKTGTGSTAGASNTSTSTAGSSTAGRTTSSSTNTGGSNAAKPTGTSGSTDVAIAEPADPTPPSRGSDPWANADFNAPRVQLVSTTSGTSGTTTTGSTGSAAPTGSAAAPGTSTGTTTGTSPAPTAPAAPGASQQYVIEPGDTFSSISQKFYGDSKHFDLLVKANPSVNPGRMKPGVSIVVPPLPAKATALADDRADVSVAPIDPRTQYVVQPGDNLNKISSKLYGTSQKWSAIHQANRKLLGEDATKLKPGMVLTLPEPPTQGVR